MNNNEQQTKLGTALQRSANELAEKTSQFSKANLYQLADAYQNQELRGGRGWLKLRYALFVIPAAAVLAIIFSPAIVNSSMVQNRNLKRATQEYTENLMPEQTTWVYESLIGTNHSTYIDEYVETIIDVQNPFLVF
jgi:ABC-type multidrug transport system permease subunit